jgi:hypothetical protein
MGRVLGVMDIYNKNYKVLEDVDQWVIDALGRLPDPFHIIVIGKRKNGKTSFVMKLCKSLAKKYKIFYSSREEGDSVTIQDAYKRVDMKEVAGKMFLGDGFSFEELVEKLKATYYKIVVIDSLDYMKLTKIQYQTLIETFPRKSFIIICWGQKKGRDWVADDYFGNKIAFMVGAVVGIADFKTDVIGRYGPTDEYVIWEKKPSKGTQLKLMS